MLATRRISLGKLISWSAHHLIWALLFSGGVAALYHYKILSFSIPWLPVSVIGVAVAFYVGFKNNSAYDRMWEARKIWGAIINTSRSWGSYVDGFVTDQFADHKVSEQEIKEIKKRLIYRHIAWLYALRSQLLKVAPWEHASEQGIMGKTARRFQKDFGIGLVDEEVMESGIKQFLQADEHDRLIKSANSATQILNEQSRDLREIRKQGLIDDFRHMEMMQHIQTLYDHQGKNERIKKFPLPRQYANMSRYFVGIFIVIMPFSMIPKMLEEGGETGFWAAIPITALIAWIFTMMEVIGDYSENPFQGMGNDIPMLSICRGIEIDMREMLGETDLPPNIEIKKGILM